MSQEAWILDGGRGLATACIGGGQGTAMCLQVG